MEQEVEQVLCQFELVWNDQPAPDLPQFAATSLHKLDTAARATALKEVVKIDLERRWQLGDKLQEAPSKDASDTDKLSDTRPPSMWLIEDYVAALPELAVSVELLAEEYRVRHRWGDAPSHREYWKRFTNLAKQLEAALAEIDRQLAGPEPSFSSNPSDVILVDDEPDSPRLAEVDDPMTMLSAEDVTIHDIRAKLPEKVGRYLVQSLLGSGGFGSVYLGRDPQLDRLVAIKVLRPRRLKDQEQRDRFLHEARLAAQIRHPTIVQVHDVGSEDDRCYMVMEYIAGRTLHSTIRSTVLSPRAAARLVLALSDAVHEAHRIGLVHRDLKPANILVDVEGRPYITDFGLAIHENDQRRGAGEVAGTPVYMAPEQVRGESHLQDGRTDIWALGVMLYEMLCGRQPFTANKVDLLFDEITDRDPKPPRQVDDAIPAELERICLRCLSKDMADRYTTGKDLASDLREFLDAKKSDDASLSVGNESRAPSSSFGDAGLWNLLANLGTNTNLPRRSNQFVGRQRERREIVELLRENSAGCLTLTGFGGLGKSRLAMEVGAELLDELPGGCWWIELERATTAPEIAQALLKPFEVPLSGKQDVIDLVDGVLQYREPLLLILDNFEQTVEHAAATVGFWRSRSPHVRFLVTSRSPLSIEGERRYELEPLRAPKQVAATDSVEHCGQFESVQLFVERAQEVDNAFQLNESNARDIAEICNQLDGIPLALELAASRIAVLKPAQLLKRLDQKLQLLKSSRRDLASRQQTLEGTIDWSYNLLAEHEQDALLQVCVLPGTFSLEAAEDIVDLSPFSDAAPIIDVVQKLRSNCLLRVVDAPQELRYDIYRSIREYGQQKLLREHTPEATTALRDRATNYLLRYARQWDQAISSPDGGEALDRMFAEIDNIHAVQDWALESGDQETATEAMLLLVGTMTRRGITEEYCRRLDRCDPPTDEQRAQLLTARSKAWRATGSWDEAAAAAQQAVKLCQTREDSKTKVEALLQCGKMYSLRGEALRASNRIDEAESMARRLGLDHLVSTAMASRGFVEWQRGHVDSALDYYNQAAKFARRIGDPGMQALITLRRGQALARRGSLEEAMSCFVEAEVAARHLGDRHIVYLALSGKGMVFSERGDYLAAIDCYQEAEATTREIGEKRGIAVNVSNRGLAMTDLGNYEVALECFETAEQLNREMGTLAGIALNLGNRGAALGAMEQYDAALQCLQEAERLNRQIENRMLIAMNLGDQGCVLQRQGKPQDAQAALSRAIELLIEVDMESSQEHFIYLTAHAIVEAELGNQARARDLAQYAQELASKLNLSESHPRIRTRQAMASLRGCLAREAD